MLGRCEPAWGPPRAHICWPTWTPYGTHLEPMWASPGGPHMVPTLSPRGPAQVGPTIYPGTNLCGPHMGCPHGSHQVAHLGPMWGQGNNVGWVWVPAGSHFKPTWAPGGIFRLYPFGSRLGKPIWDPAGPHMGPMSNAHGPHVGFFAYIHVGPGWESPCGTHMCPGWAPYGSHFEPT